MPLLKPPEPVITQRRYYVRIEERLAQTIERYAEFLGTSSIDHVIAQALQFIFKRDAQFKSWLEQNPEPTPKPAQSNDRQSFLFPGSPAPNRARSSRHCTRPLQIRAASRLSRHADRSADKCASHWLLACPHSSRLLRAHSVATRPNRRQILAQTSAGVCRLRKPRSGRIDPPDKTGCF